MRIRPSILEMAGSGIRQVMARAAQLESMGRNVIHLEVGQPDFQAPSDIVSETTRWLTNGATTYCPNAGVDPLRHAIAARITRKTGVAVRPEEILVTVGAQQALATLMLMLCDPGDEVLIPDPSFPNFGNLCRTAHAKPVHYHLDPSTGFLPTVDGVASCITNRTRVLLLNSPSNPTGGVIPRHIMDKLLQLASHHGIAVISDEVYSDFVFDAPHCSGLTDESKDYTVLVGSASKMLSVTGFRVGWFRAPPYLVSQATKLQEVLVSCGAPFAQGGVVVGLEDGDDVVESMRREYKLRRDAAVHVLKSYGLHEYTPDGAFYLFVNIGRSGMGSEAFSAELLEEHSVGVAPGLTFGDNYDHYVRCSFCCGEDDVREGFDRLCRLVTSAERRGAV